jgi:hypothetical protein
VPVLHAAGLFFSILDQRGVLEMLRRPFLVFVVGRFLLSPSP